MMPPPRCIGHRKPSGRGRDAAMTALEHRSCCAPVQLAVAPRRPDAPAATNPAGSPGRSGAGLVALDGGWFRMGSDDVYAYEEDGEGPVRSVRVDPFRIAAGAVSNREFA